jgi:hypothetical protein
MVTKFYVVVEVGGNESKKVTAEYLIFLSGCHSERSLAEF